MPTQDRPVKTTLFSVAYEWQKERVGRVRDRIAAGWKAFGGFLSSHMVVIVLCGLTLGILAPDVLGPLQPAVPYLFAFVSFSNALGLTFDALRRTLSHPGPLLLMLAFAHVLVPLLGFGVGSLVFAGQPEIVAGIVLEYATPIATSMVMWVGICRGDVAAALATLLVSTLISPFTIPLTMQLLVGATVDVDAVGMIWSVLWMIAIPALVGMVVNELSHGWASLHVAPLTSPAQRAFVPLIVSVNSTTISGYILHPTALTVEVVVFIGCFAVGNFLLGALMARLTRQKDPLFVTMTFACGMRNITAGAVIAVQHFGGTTILPVMAGVLFQQLLASAVGPVMQKYLARRRTSLAKRQG